MTSAPSTQATSAPFATSGALRRGRSAAGLGAGITAGLVWGLSYLLVVLVGGWNPVIVTVGRYLAYGVLSALLFAVGGRRMRELARQHWRRALLFALAGNVGYYLLLVVGIRTAGAPLTDMVIGAIPVVVAVVGNWLSPAYRWRRLTLPLILVTAGLLLVSTLEIAGVHAYQPGSAGEKMAGLIAACGAVVLWTWYALANGRFLAAHQAASPARWSTVVGVATGVVTLAGLPLAAVAGQLAAPASGKPGIAALVAAVVILGVVVSWAGTWLWNLTSARLSPTLAGLLVNVETVAGFVYVYAAKLQWPPPGQLTGLLLVVTGVTLAVPRPQRVPTERRRQGVGSNL